MTKEALDEEFWVIGNVETGMYLHWKGDAVTGVYVDCADPEDAERYDTAEEAAAAIQEDKDIQAEIANWSKSAGPVHVKKGVTVSDGTPGVYSSAKRNAKLLFCMDYIMHALNDEEAIADWLAVGVPDGTNEEDVTVAQLKPYLDLGVSDSDFDRMAGVFIQTLALQGGGSCGNRTFEEIGKAVLA